MRTVLNSYAFLHYLIAINNTNLTQLLNNHEATFM